MEGELPTVLNDSSDDILNIFKGAKAYLDDKQDRIHRVVNLSRGVTYQSKGIIFLLHRMLNKMEIDPTVLETAEKRFTNLKLEHNDLYKLAEELQNQDHLAYRWYYRFGLEEYIEALALWNYLKCGKIITYAEAQATLNIQEKGTRESNGGGKLLQIFLPRDTYMEGLADFTGELMRICILAAAMSKTDIVFKTCFVVQEFHRGMNGLCELSNMHSRLNNKVPELTNSVVKMEEACYKIKIRDGNDEERKEYKPAVASFWNIENIDKGYDEEERKNYDEEERNTYE